MEVGTEEEECFGGKMIFPNSSTSPLILISSPVSWQFLLFFTTVHRDSIYVNICKCIDYLWNDTQETFDSDFACKEGTWVEVGKTLFTLYFLYTLNCVSYT